MSAPRVKLTPQPIPKSLVRVTIAGEFLKNMGLISETDIRNVQQAVAEGLVSELVIVGVNYANIGKECFTLRFVPLGDDVAIHLDLNDGKSTTEALDTGFAGAVAYSVQLMRRRNLRPVFYFGWSAYALSNRSLIQSACQRLNLIEYNPPALQLQSNPTYSPPTPSPSSPSNASRDFIPTNNTQSMVHWGPKPPPPANHTYTPVLTIKPAKDPGITYIIETATRQK